MLLLEDKIQSLANSIRTGKTTSDKIKITTIWLLRSLQEVSPSQTRKYLDVIARGKCVETDVRFSIKTLHDFFIFSSLWEKELEDFFEFREGMTFLDVGAHIGKYTLRAAKKIGSKGKVIAIEPDRDSFAFLVRNIKLNKLRNCIPLNVAAYHADCEVSLFMGPYSAQNSIKEDFQKGSYKVKARALDNVLRELRIRGVDFVKIDVEGAELDVLEGLQETLKKQNPVLIIELMKRDSEKTINYLADLGYKRKLLNLYAPFRGGLLYYRFAR